MIAERALFCLHFCRAWEMGRPSWSCEFRKDCQDSEMADSAFTHYLIPSLLFPSAHLLTPFSQRLTIYVITYEQRLLFRAPKHSSFSQLLFAMKKKRENKKAHL